MPAAAAAASSASLLCTRGRLQCTRLNLSTKKDKMVSEAILKKRACVERWKLRNMEYYLAQKRLLSGRPEYLARRRELYRIRREEFVRQHGLPKRGRPRSCCDANYPSLRKYCDGFEERSEAGDRFCDLSECCPTEFLEWCGASFYRYQMPDRELFLTRKASQKLANTIIKSPGCPNPRALITIRIRSGRGGVSTSTTCQGTKKEYQLGILAPKLGD